MSSFRTVLAVSLVVVAAGLTQACSEGPEGPGRLSVSLAAASAPASVEGIWVEVTAVLAHQEGSGWFTVSEAPVRVNLLALQDHAEDLGLVTLPAGRVTQLRLVVAEEGNVVVQGGVELPLTVPSGYESGIKILGPWGVESCAETAVALELDGEQSIQYHPTGAGEWILRPVIRTVGAVQVPGECEEPAPACVPAECASGVCDALGERCAPGGAYAPCDAPEACLSGACVEGSCAPGDAGAACRVTADCAAPLECLQATCADPAIAL